MKKYNLFIIIFVSFFIYSSFFNLFTAESNEATQKISFNISSVNESSIEAIVVLKEKNLLKGSEKLEQQEKEIKSKYHAESESSSFKGFSAELTKDELIELSKNNMVKHITLNRKVKAFLQDSLNLINASLTWSLQQDNINLTGAGQTICIIDTGVNYSHPDLGGCYGNNNPNSGCKVIGGWDYVNGNSNPMDDNGHGTHVAGIASSNKTIKGIAPDSKIIAIKVLDSSGSGNDFNILSGIRWCIDNASIFNISVISLSLGIDCSDNPTWCYNNYCDDNPLESEYKSAINSAVLKNISVVTATGNDGNKTSLGAPACIRNSTRVGSSNKNDVFSSFSNRGVNFEMLLAPGESINSTMLSSPSGTILSSCGTNKNYCSLTGTSMATPHVSGAIAIIKQYLNSRNIIKTNKEIEYILNNTGRRIYDSSSGLNFSRINIYSAITSIEEFPIITFYSPTPQTGTYSNMRSLAVNITVTNLGSINITLNVYNSTGLFNYTNTTSKNLFYNFTNLVDGIYFYNATSCNSLNNCNKSENRNITIDLASPYFFNNLTSGNYFRYSNFSFNATIRDGYSLSYIWIESNHTGSLLNYTYNLTSLEHNISKSYNITSQHNKFSYKFYINDSAGNINFSSLTNVEIKNNPPVNLTLNNISWSKNSNYTFNISSYFYDVDGDSMIFSNTSISNISVYINSSAGIVILEPSLNFNGTRTIIFYANDSINITASNNISLIIYSPIINYSRFNGNTTEFSNLNNFVNTSIIIEKRDYGRINFSNVNINESNMDLDTNINISFNRIEINSTNLPMLNISARLTLKNLSFNNPRVLKNGVYCSSCSEIDYASGEFVFEVDSFSVYTSEETPVLSADSNGGGGGGGGGSSSIILKQIKLDENLKTQNLAVYKNERINLSFFEQRIIIKITDINKTHVALNLSTNNKTKSFILESSKKIIENLNSQYLEFFLNAIEPNYKANITLTARDIEQNNLSPNETTITESLEEEINVNKTKNQLKYWLIICSILILISFICILFNKKRKNAKKYKKKKVLYSRSKNK